MLCSLLRANQAAASQAATAAAFGSKSRSLARSRLSFVLYLDARATA